MTTGAPPESQESTGQEATGQRATSDKVVAQSAGLAFMGKLGAVIEPLGVIIFANLYGAATLGIFMLLWGYVMISTGASDLAMTTALQRYVPSTTDEDRIHRVLKAGLIISGILSLVIAVALTLAAPWLAGYINAAPEVTPDLPVIVAIYAWAIPLWCYIEVTTAAVRARRAFGPEVKVRIFYEQGLRIVSGVLFFFLGFQHYGLFLSHLLALFVAGLLSTRLLGEYYDLKRLWSAPLSADLFRELIHFGSPMTGSNVMKRFHSNFPIFVLNFIIPGAAGAVAVAVFAVARKVVSALQVIRQSFEYVIAPLASAENALAGKAALRDMYAFSTRLIWSLFMPVGAGVVALRNDIASLVGPTFAGAGVLIGILSVGRAFEAATGPSQALQEMLAKSRVSLINGLIGFAVTALLMIWMTPLWGSVGAAVATAIGINVPSFLSLYQINRLYGLQPYDRRMLQPALWSFAGAALVFLAVAVAGPLGIVLRFSAGLIALFSAYFILLRFGFSERDAAAFGRIARWIRN